MLLVAIAYGAGAIRIPGQAGEPGPGFLPLALAVLLAVLSVAILAKGVKRATGSMRTAGAERKVGVERGTVAESGIAQGLDVGGDPLSGAPPRARTVGPYLAALATITYAALFQPLGFVLSTLAYSGYLTSLFSEDRTLRLSVPILVTLTLFVFFRLVLGVRLPPGLLG